MLKIELLDGETLLGSVRTDANDKEVIIPIEKSGTITHRSYCIEGYSETMVRKHEGLEQVKAGDMVTLIPVQGIFINVTQSNERT